MVHLHAGEGSGGSRKAEGGDNCEDDSFGGLHGATSIIGIPSPLGERLCMVRV